MIFDRGPKEFHGPKPRIMSNFDYLNASSRPEAERVRCLLEEWGLQYPLQGRAELISRLRSRNDVNHLSAVFELTLHELLRRSDTGITLHPNIPGASGRPDFLVHPTTGSPYYLEATLCFETTGYESGEKLLAQVYDILDRIDSPRFFIGIGSHGVPCAPLSARRLRKKLLQWLDYLDESQLTEAWAQGETGSTELTHVEAGVRLVFTAIPKRIHRSGTRAIGAHFPEARWSAVAETIKSRLLDKVGKYGRPKIPMVVAVNAFGLSVDRDDVMDALFGHVADLVEPRDTRGTTDANSGGVLVRPSRQAEYTDKFCDLDFRPRCVEPRH